MNSRINVNNVVYDDVTNYGITIINNNGKEEMYLIKDGKAMKLSSLIIKEREGKA
jgi:uncharacterized membrane-anchored protein